MSAVQFTAEWQGNSIQQAPQKRDDDTTQRKRHSIRNAFFL